MLLWLGRRGDRLDGTSAAATTIHRKRSVFYNVLEYAAEVEELSANSLGRVKWKPPRVAELVDLHHPYLGSCPDAGPGPGAGCLAPGGPALRPAARRGLALAERRGRGHGGG